MLWKIRKALPFVVPLLCDVGFNVSGIHIPWLGYSLIGLAVLGAIYWIYAEIRERRLSKLAETAETKTTSDSKASTIKLLKKIKGQEPSRQPHIVFSTVLSACCLIIFLSGLYFAYLIIVGKIPIPNSPNLLLLFLIFVAFPIYGLVDLWFLNRKYYRLNRSKVAKQAEIVFKSDVNTVFEKCLKILDVRPQQTSTIEIEPPKLIKAQIRGSIITIAVRNIGHNQAKVNIESDSQWRTVKFDFGVNQRNIDKIVRLLILEMGSTSIVDKPVSDEGKHVALRARRGGHISVENSVINGYPEVASANDQGTIKINRAKISKQNIKRTS
jgi:uncharacterized protein (DUF1499 family)